MPELMTDASVSGALQRTLPGCKLLVQFGCEAEAPDMQCGHCDNCTL